MGKFVSCAIINQTQDKILVLLTLVSDILLHITNMGP